MRAHVLGVILGRAGSKGLPNKVVRPLAGRPMIEYTLDHALAAKRLTDIAFTTDSAPARRLAEARGVRVVQRPPALADDTATVDSAARHAVELVEDETGKSFDAIVLLYAAVAIRPPGLIDRVVDKLLETGADSVRTVAPIGKHHPDWLHRLDDDDRMRQFRPNSIYRRQDLEPLYYHDGAVVAVTRGALFGDLALRDPQGFLGSDRRALRQGPTDSVDVDDAFDLLVAEAALRFAHAHEGLAASPPRQVTT